MSNHKLLFVCVVVLSVCVLSANADFDWFNTTTNRVGYDSSTVIPIGSDQTDSCFVQLIWAGPNNLIDAIVNSGTGVSGDDQVHQLSWINANGFTDGLSENSLWSGSSNGYYYVRVWNSASPNFASGLIPTASTNRYGESALWANPGGASDSFNFGGAGNASSIGITTTLQAIPEPAMFGLGLVGLISLRFFGRKRK